jgi:hypothetical protein
MRVVSNGSASGPLHVLQAVFTTLFLTAGFGFLALSVARGRGPFSLLSGDAALSFILRFQLITAVLGTTVAAMAIAGLVLLARPAARAARTVYAGLAAASLAALLTVAVLALAVHGRRGSVGTRDAVQAAWTGGIAGGDPRRASEICAVEAKFRCRGFQDFDCVGCALGTEAACSPSAGNAGDRCARCGVSGKKIEEGCWRELSRALGETYLPVGITCVVLALCVLANLVALAVQWGRADRGTRLGRKYVPQQTAQRPAQRRPQRKAQQAAQQTAEREVHMGKTRSGVATGKKSATSPRRNPTDRRASPPSPQRKDGRVDPRSIDRIPKRPPRKYPYIQ